MNSLLILVATAALGVEVGWEPLPGGGYEYTIQIEPELLKVLEQGNDEIFSEVPNGIDVRRYRVMVGVGKLRRESAPLAAGAPADQSPAAAPVAQQAPPAQPAFSPPPATAPPTAPPTGPPAVAPFNAAASDPFGTPPSDLVDPEAELDADLGQHAPGGAVAPVNPPAATNSLRNSPAAAQNPYEAPPAAVEAPLNTAPPAAIPAAGSNPPVTTEPTGPAMPDFGNSAAAPPAGKTPAATAPAGEASGLAALGGANAAAANSTAGNSTAGNSTGLEAIPPNPFTSRPPAAESQGCAEVVTVSPPAADKSDVAQAPAKLPSDRSVAGPIKEVTFDENGASPKAEERETGKPELTGQVPSRPWFPLVASIVLLGCSIGGNVFLGWVAYDARNRYRTAIAKFRGAAA